MGLGRGASYLNLAQKWNWLKGDTPTVLIIERRFLCAVLSNLILTQSLQQLVDITHKYFACLEIFHWWRLIKTMEVGSALSAVLSEEAEKKRTLFAEKKEENHLLDTFPLYHSTSAGCSCARH